MDINIIWETGTIEDKEKAGLADLLRGGLETALGLLELKTDLTPELGLLVTDDEGIRVFNREYREVDAPTDVLSFALLEETAEDRIYVHESHVLGDIVISAQTAARQAEGGSERFCGGSGHSLEWEMVFLSVHGLLHLCGYNHETDEEHGVMSRWEEDIMRCIDQELFGGQWTRVE